MRIFLISGKAGSGKNEVAKIIKDNLGSTVITGFSKYIKLFALEFTDWDGRDITKPREFLQLMGDKLRAMDENFLTNRLLEDFKIYETEFNNVVVSDVRLPHELEYLKSNSKYEVITIRVNSNKSVRDLSEDEKHHHTELDLDNYESFDYIINNNFDDSLELDVKNIIDKIRNEE